jgi:hypothetical protein
MATIHAFPSQPEGCRVLTLSDVVARSHIICYKEQVDQLQKTLDQEKLKPFVARAQYTGAQAGYSNVFKCFMGHRDAWRAATAENGFTLICEADFVPCARLGSLPVFWPIDRKLAWGYLYQGSPRLLWLSASGQYLRGHTAPTVAYIVNSDVARIFLGFFDDQMQQYRPEDYFTFESHLQWWTMGHGAEAYIPLRHYGEHGGIPQSEHGRFGAKNKGVHRADNLAAPLAFLPQYARGSRLSFVTERAIARAYGWARLFSGRWIVDTNVYSRSRWDTVRMYMVGARRLLPGG